MKIYLIKTFNGLKPVGVNDDEKYKKIPQGEILEYEVKIGRNVAFHRKYFAMLNMAFQNQEEFKSFELFREAIQIGAGFFERKQRLHGEEIIDSKSISFAKMDEEEFSRLYTSVMDTIIDYFGWDKKGFESELQEIGKFY